MLAHVAVHATLFGVYETVKDLGMKNLPPPTFLPLKQPPPSSQGALDTTHTADDGADDSAGTDFAIKSKRITTIASSPLVSLSLLNPDSNLLYSIPLYNTRRCRSGRSPCSDAYYRQRSSRGGGGGGGCEWRDRGGCGRDRAALCPGNIIQERKIESFLIVFESLEELSFCLLTYDDHVL